MSNNTITILKVTYDWSENSQSPINVVVQGSCLLERRETVNNR